MLLAAAAAPSLAIRPPLATPLPSIRRTPNAAPASPLPLSVPLPAASRAPRRCALPTPLALSLEALPTDYPTNTGSLCCRSRTCIVEIFTTSTAAAG